MENQEGYIREMEYVHGVYRELGPTSINLVLLVQSLEPVPLHDGFSYCDLGCGQGLSVSLFAACHPEGEFHGIDFNPVHITGARALAGEAGLENVTFHEASFADLDTVALPQFDFVVLHGIYTWVGDVNRSLIIRFLQQKLKPGGVVFLSYNSLPGWSPHAPVRQLLASYAEGESGALEQRVERALEFVRQLKEAQAAVFAGNPATAEFFDYLCTLPRNYLAHEFFNRDWTLFYHADVVRDLAAAGLEFAGSAKLAENQDMLRFSAAQQQIVERARDRVMRETLKDFCSAPLLRRDLFTRGRRRLAPSRQMEHFSGCRFALVVPPAMLERKALFPIGEVLFDQELYQPILLALEQKPHSLEELLKRDEVRRLGTGRVTEALMVLLSAEYLLPWGEASALSMLRTRKLNQALLERQTDEPGEQSLASPLLRNAIKLGWLERQLVLCEMKRTGDSLGFVWEQMQAQRHDLAAKGESPASDEERLSELMQQVNSFRALKLPLLRRLGLL